MCRVGSDQWDRLYVHRNRDQCRRYLSSIHAVRSGDTECSIERSAAIKCGGVVDVKDIPGQLLLELGGVRQRRVRRDVAR